jgi:hypothetical protein
MAGRPRQLGFGLTAPARKRVAVKKEKKPKHFPNLALHAYGHSNVGINNSRYLNSLLAKVPR